MYINEPSTKFEFIGNGRIKGDRGEIWFIDGFFTFTDDDLKPLNLKDKYTPNIRVNHVLRVFRLASFVSMVEPYEQREWTEVITRTIPFRQVEYFDTGHPLEGQIKSIIFKER